MYSRPTAKNREPGVHEGSRHQFLNKHRETVRRAFADKGVDTLYPRLLELIADTRNLRAAWDYLARFGGQAPGPNSWTYSDFLEDEVWEFLKVLRSAIREKGYSPGPTRKVEIPKGQGRGSRTLTLQNIQDRVVQRAILQVIEPILDPGFDVNSFGGRPARGPLGALATAVHLLGTQDRTVWITEDLKDAFDHVPLSRLMQVFEKRLPAESVVEIVERVVRDPAGQGLAQGAPLSPLLMNLYLDQFFDRPWRHRSTVPALRYIDDLLVLCAPLDEFEEVYQLIARLMNSAGMRLKGWLHALHMLDIGDWVEWLGYHVRLEAGELRVFLDQDRWFAELRDHLVLAHAKPQPALKAIQIIRGKLAYAGPAYVHTDTKRFYEVLATTCAELSFEELPSFEKIDEWWARAHGRWLLEQQCVKRAASKRSHLATSGVRAGEVPF